MQVAITTVGNSSITLFYLLLCYTWVDTHNLVTSYNF
nr:MAG TPA: hypothetical protein [Bacteriophage sp.]